MTSREAFESTFTPLRYKMKRICGEYVATDTETAWLGWQTATERAVEAALSAPVKTDKQDQREACANAIMAR
jgi:hypothetical protein